MERLNLIVGAGIDRSREKPDVDDNLSAGASAPYDRGFGDYNF
jgi:hypothetical protein